MVIVYKKDRYRKREKKVNLNTDMRCLQRTTTVLERKTAGGLLPRVIAVIVVTCIVGAVSTGGAGGDQSPAVGRIHTVVPGDFGTYVHPVGDQVDIVGGDALVPVLWKVDEFALVSAFPATAAFGVAVAAQKLCLPIEHDLWAV